MTRLPERLRAGEGTELERRLLLSAASEQPSRELSQQMAAALGISAQLLLAAPKPSLSTGSTAPKVVAARGWRALLPWLSGAFVALAAGGAVLAFESHQHSTPLPAALADTQLPSPRSSASAPDLRAQRSLIDAARAALSAESGDRALEILREYRERYGAGGFSPEASALQIEALMASGRDAEATALAARFVSEYRGSALAERVAKLTGVGD